MRNTERLYDRVIEKMDMTCDMEDEELQELIHEVLEEASKEEFIPVSYTHLDVYKRQLLHLQSAFIRTVIHRKA